MKRAANTQNEATHASGPRLVTSPATSAAKARTPFATTSDCLALRTGFSEWSEQAENAVSPTANATREACLAQSINRSMRIVFLGLPNEKEISHGRGRW